MTSHTSVVGDNSYMRKFNKNLLEKEIGSILWEQRGLKQKVTFPYEPVILFWMGK